MKNLKLVVLWAFVVGGLGLISYSVHADGSFQPVLAPNATGGQYLYPTSPAPSVGGVLVNDAVQAFRWSNGTVSSTSTSTTQQFLALTPLTKTQIQGASGIIPATTGQLVLCTNCNTSPVCASTGSTTSFQWVAVGTAAASGFQVCN